MYLIAGLGNPDRKYQKTKHNAGFDSVDEIIERFHIPKSGISMKGLYGKGLIAGEKVMIVKPLTYMNLSGHCIRAFADYYKIDVPERLIVIYDDVDLPVGSVRIRKNGSAGSHNGMKSIIEQLGTRDFIRIRVGIGPKPERADLADYVLAPFSKEDRKKIEEVMRLTPDIVEKIIESGVSGAMNLYNKKAAKADEGTETAGEGPAVL